ncbi:hypothetical protein [Methanosphaerula palustris]|nr:hypothetical protein [Methanosphaerula palustris]
MKYRGINYDVGTNYRQGRSSREEFDPAVVEQEIGIIDSELHCNAIRISGYDISRLVVASEYALAHDLTVFFSPSTINASRKETEDYILRGALAAEELRVKYEKVIYVAGCELSLFSQGFIRGDTTEARLRQMFGPLSILMNAAGIPRGYNKNLNMFFRKMLPEIKKLFGGQVTYASGTWESVDWSLFDLVGIDHYRSSYNRSLYRDQLKGYFRHGKPVVVLEFGCCCYRGAEDKGPAGWMIVDWDRDRPELKGNFVRDESVQSEYLMELLDIFSDEPVAGAFVFTFVQPSYVSDENPKYDLDMAGYGIVKMLAKGSEPSCRNMPWVPKKAFSLLADYYSR